VSGARDRWCKFGWERRCGPGAKEEEREREGDCDEVSGRSIRRSGVRKRDKDGWMSLVESTGLTYLHGCEGARRRRRRGRVPGR
jgi:hypothetical protein